MSAKRITCPACHKHNYTVWDNGTSKCWNCGHSAYNSSAPLITLCRSPFIEEIRQLYDELSAYYHSCLDTKAIDFLNRRGINDSSIQELRLGFCPDTIHLFYKSKIARYAGVATSDNKPVLGNRIIFPYFAFGDVTDLSGRDVTGESEKKYKFPYHSAFQRGAEYPYLFDQCAGALKLVITEGPIKAILSWQNGIDCIALPGMLSWRNGFVQQPGQKITIIFDSQVKHRRELQKAIQQAAKRVYQPRIGTLPLKNKEKQDIDQFILDYGAQEYRKIVETALDYDTWKVLSR